MRFSANKKRKVVIMPVVNICVLLQTNSNPDLAPHLAQTERRAMPEVQNVADALRTESELASPEFLQE